jgi:hypothetical protein
MPQAVYILFGAGFTVAVCMALGQVLLTRLGLPLFRQEQYLFAFLSGAPCLSVVVFLLASAGLARKGVFLAVGLAALAAGWRFRPGSPAGPLPALPRFWRRLFWGLFGVFTLIYFFNAMAPEISADGSAYHLGLVSRYLRERGFRRLTTNMYGMLSQGVEMLFMFAFAFGRHSAAALVHFAFLVSLPLAMLAWARRFGHAAAGVIGALLVYLSPVVGVDGISAYIDVAVASVLFGIFYLLEIWERERRPALLVVVGLLAGFAYAAKYTAFLAVPYALGFVAWRLWRARQPLLRPLVVMSVCAALMMLPWLARNALWFNNPFAPFLNRLFPNPYVHIDFEEDYIKSMQNYGELPSRWHIPYQLLVRGENLCGLLGPMFALAPLALAALRFQAGRRLLAAGLLFGLPYYANIGTRFLIPSLPFVALAMGLAVAAWQKLAAAMVLLHALLSLPWVVHRYCGPWAWRIRTAPVRQALRLEPEESFLARRLPGYVMARFIEDTTPPGARVFTFSQLPEAYTTRNILVHYQSASNSVLADILWIPLAPERQPVDRLAFVFPARRVQKIRVLQTGRSQDPWSITELRAFHAGWELARSPIWRLRAQPNPTDVQMAFDNSPVTRWRSWERMRPGMFVEVDFGREEAIDTVAVDCSADQPEALLRLEAQDRWGRWQALADAPRKGELAPPLGLRREATRELRARGVGYLSILDSDFGAGDFRANAHLWGLKLLGTRGPAALYEIAE